MAVKHFGTVGKRKGTKIERIYPSGQKSGQIGIESQPELEGHVTSDRSKLEGHLYPELRKKATNCDLYRNKCF